MPKLRPSVSLPAMMRQRPTTEIVAVYESGSSPAVSPTRNSGGPIIDTTAVIRAIAERSTRSVGRRTIVSTTTSASLASSSNPVR